MCWHHLWRGWKRYAANLLKKFFKSTIFPSNIKKHRNIKGWEVDVLNIRTRIGLKSKIGNFYFNRPAEAESHLVKRFTFQHFKTEHDVFVGSDRCWCLHPDLRSSCLPLWVGHHEASSLVGRSSQVKRDLSDLLPHTLSPPSHLGRIYFQFLISFSLPLSPVVPRPSMPPPGAVKVQLSLSALLFRPRG